MYLQQNPIDPTLPESLPPADLTDWPRMLDELLSSLFTPTDPPMLDLGNNLWTGLASIVVVWTGLRIAFAGASFRPWDLVQLVIGLSIPLGMLRFYANDVPGVGISFPMLIPAGANQIAELFRADIITEMNAGLHQLADAYTQNMAAAVESGGGGLEARINGFLENTITRIFSWVFQGFLTLGYAGIFAICMAQVFWAQIAISILIFLGPVFIPFLVFEPLKFLFWGWFRAMLTYSFYAVIAAAIMRVWCSLSLTMLNSLVANSLNFTDVLDGGPNVHAVAVIPLFAAAFLSAMKVPELAGAIVGGPSGGGGISALVATAMTGGRGKILKMAGGAK